jgi:hypothetical protein
LAHFLQRQKFVTEPSVTGGDAGMMALFVLGGGGGIGIFSNFF